MSKVQRWFIQPGDVIVYAGAARRVDRIVQGDDGKPVARARDGWGISLNPDHSLVIRDPDDRYTVRQHQLPCRCHHPRTAHRVAVGRCLKISCPCECYQALYGPFGLVES